MIWKCLKEFYCASHSVTAKIDLCPRDLNEKLLGMLDLELQQQQLLLQTVPGHGQSLFINKTGPVWRSGSLGYSALVFEHEHPYSILAPT